MKISRRLLPWLLLLASAIGCVLLLGRGLPSGVPGPGKPRESSFYALGTFCRIRASGPRAEAALEAARERIGEIDRRMSARRADSDLARIGARAGRGSVSVPADLEGLLALALAVAQASGGAFDPTVAPLSDLWGIGTERARVPSEGEIRRALRLVDWRALRLTRGDAAPRAGLARPGMGLDLGGIAKGYAADEALRLLRAGGVNSALIDLGGNLSVLGTRPDGRPWRLGVQDPERPRGEALAALDARDGESLVTSGAYERHLDTEGRRYGHILDPATGHPAEPGLLSVSVLGPRSALADALSTALYVRGLPGGLALLRAFPGYEAAFLLPDGRLVATGGLRARLIPLRPGLAIEAAPGPEGKP